MQRNLAEPSNEVLAELLPAPVLRKIPLVGGGNSRLSKVETVAGEWYVVKQYQADRPWRDPLTCEFASLEFLWANGVRCIPRPVAMLPGQRSSVFEFIEGQRLCELDVVQVDLDPFSDFVDLLCRLQHADGIGTVPLASEACFTPNDFFAAIDRRLAKLGRVDDADLQGYLADEFVAVYERVRRGFDADGQQPCGEGLRRLSPSDFGIHNALLRSNGDLAFVDFEYFGWDDPAKMISDFLLHPANEPIPWTAKHTLAAKMIDVFADPDLAGRIRLCYPLCGLNWCLILLNEFLSDELVRRLHAQGRGDENIAGGSGVTALQQKQLDRSRARLEQMTADRLECPYV